MRHTTDQRRPAGLLISLFITLMFIGALVRPPLGTFVALAWILAMVLVFAALLLFLLETRLATRTARDLRRLPRQIPEQEKEQ